MSTPLPPPRPSSWLHGVIYDFSFALVHSILTFAAALMRKDLRRPKAQQQQCRQNDDLEQGQVGYTPSNSETRPSLSLVGQKSKSRNASQLREFQQQHNRILCQGRKSVQFELPKKRACPPLGRIDILSPPSSPPAPKSRSPMHCSLDIFRSRASNPRVHHATYFLD